MQDKLNNIKEYFQSMELIEGKWVICVKYKEKWGAYPSEDGTINAVPDEKVPNVYWYFPTNDSTGIDDIVALIEETVQTNLDAVKKAELFKEKAIELKRLFADELISYNKLKTLKFVFDESSEPPAKKKSVKKTKPKTKKEIMSQAVDEADEQDKVPEEMPEMTQDEKMEHSTVTAHVDEGAVMNATDMTQAEIDDLRG